MALAAGIYMAALGKHGLRRVAELTYHNAHYLAGQIDALPDYAVWQEPALLPGICRRAVPGPRPKSTPPYWPTTTSSAATIWGRITPSGPPPAGVRHRNDQPGRHGRAGSSFAERLHHEGD
jgi:hypothetical protein